LHAYLWKKMNLTKWVMTAGMVGILVIAVMNGVAYLPDMEHPFIPTEETALYLKGIVQPGDIIVVTNPYDMSLIYYLVYHGVSKEYTKDIARQSFQRAYVVVYPESGQTVLSVIEATGLDPRVLQPASARLLANISNAFVYECLPVALNPG
jgi:signal peptidase I